MYYIIMKDDMGQGKERHCYRWGSSVAIWMNTVLASSILALSERDKIYNNI